MSEAKPRALLSAALKEMDARLRIRPNAPELRFDRARCLELLGRTDEAMRDYRTILARVPAHVGALNGLGMLLLGGGKRAEAQALFEQAASEDPRHASSRANLAYTLLAQGETAAARVQYEGALAIDPKLAIAHHGLAEALEKLGDMEGAERHRALGIAARPITALRYTGTGTPVRILVVGSSDGGNLVMASHLDTSVFAIYALVVEAYDFKSALPEHDVVFNVIGEADRCAPALEAATALLKRTRAPVINHPANVLATGRAQNAARLGRIDGVVAPRIERIPRTSLEDAADRWTYPLLLRSPGYHTGQHFVKVEQRADAAVAAAALPGDELLAIEYLDARGPDGKARKYRAMIVDRTIYPLHAAVSSEWKVHYFSAEMNDRPGHRAEDAAFLEDMPGVIGQRAMQALEAIRDALALDYAGIDFGLDPSGNVLLFEANASMVVPNPGPEQKWDYRRAPVQRIRDAVRRMMTERSHRRTGT